MESGEHYKILFIALNFVLSISNHYFLERRKNATQECVI